MTAPQYSEYMLASMQATYGEGYLSPGAAPEVREMVGDFDIGDKTCLDLGCGVGGACILLATEYNPARVVGIDVENEQLRQARELTDVSNLDNVHFGSIEAGEPLPFPDSGFDFVMSKDVICHVQDKSALFREILRILKPGGMFVVGDWHRGTIDDAVSTFARWHSQLESGGLVFYFESMDYYRIALHDAGFADITATDNMIWSMQSAQNQLVHSTGGDRKSIIDTFGQEGYQRRVALTRTRLEGLQDGSIQHWHLRGFRS
jgi:phosphoethanolamine N-methyltransferase